MDEIDKILDLNRPSSDIINDLKRKSISVPEWAKLVKEYEPSLHKIVKDKLGRKDRIKSDGSVDKASRIHLGLEKLLVKRMSEFTFAIPVKRIYHNTEDSEEKIAISKAIESIYKYARIDSENIKRATAYYASCEICTVWYAVKKKNSLYGFDSEYKLKCKTYSPMDGVKLFPLIDERDDMEAMSFQFTKKMADTDVEFFETFTANGHYLWRNDKQSWILENEPEVLALSKIQCSYLSRRLPVFAGLSHLREEMEYTISRNSDIIAYNASPILVASGKLEGDEDKGESRRFYQVSNGGSISYVSWNQSIEAFKYHIEMLLKLFFMQSQMPDLSFDNMKSLGNIGFDARQMLFSDAHLKIGDESGAWIEFLERECSVIKEFLKLMHQEWKSLIDEVDVEHVITPYILNDEDAMITRLTKGNGGKAIFSQLDSIRMGGYSNDPEATLKAIQEEEAQSQETRNSGLFESVN